MSAAVIIGVIAFFAILIGVAINGAYTHYVNGINYKRIAGDWFDRADQATTPDRKLEFFDQYMKGLQAAGLDKGTNSVLDNTRPNADMQTHWQTAQDLRQELVNWQNTDPTSLTYQYQKNQITWTDFCWFPNHAFAQKYQIDHGGWGAALWPPDQYNRCQTSSSSSSTTGSSGNIPALSG